MIMVFAPLAIGVVLAVVLRSPLYLMFAIASPLMMIGNAVSDRRQTARENREAREKYERDLAAAQERIARSLAAETERRRNLHADPAAALLTAVLPGKRLWERRRSDPDALSLRLGTADLPAEVEVTGRHGAETLDEPRTVRAVPATVPLRESGVLGLAGPADQLAGLLRWVVLQLAIHHPPRDLALTLLAPRARGDWNWLRWLPHARPADGDGPVALRRQRPPTTVTARVAELAALVKGAPGGGRLRRRPDRRRSPSPRTSSWCTASARCAPPRAGPGARRTGRRSGSTPCAPTRRSGSCPRRRPPRRSSTPRTTPRCSCAAAGTTPCPPSSPNRCRPSWPRRAARALAPLRDVSVEDDDAVLPDSVRLLDVLGLEPPSVDGVRARWQLEGRTTRMVVGAGLRRAVHARPAHATGRTGWSPAPPARASRSCCRR